MHVLASVSVRFSDDFQVWGERAVTLLVNLWPNAGRKM